MRLLLASTSPARRALLDGLGIPYVAEAPGVDEDVLAGTSVEDTVRMLALRKARAVAARHPGALVIGADQLAEVDGQVLGKPASREAARAQLGSLLGRAHRLLTGLALVGIGDEQLALDVVTLRFHPVASGELERYLDTEEWRGCAGGYRIEGRGQALVDALEGDRTSVQGLPMLPLIRMLRARGFPLL
ncbi:MAG TPA: Maf family protein [Myxococcaceae bacterium]|nr:Maf family protein [Myxococcaceae bacterium]